MSTHNTIGKILSSPNIKSQEQVINANVLEWQQRKAATLQTRRGKEINSLAHAFYQWATKKGK